MTELKTLKDLELKPKRIDLPNGEIMIKVYPIIAELKAEAVKWINYFYDKVEYGWKSMFIDFFNLTEDDFQTASKNSNEEIKEMLRNMQNKSIQRKYISNGDFRRLEEVINQILSKKDEEIQKLKEDLEEMRKARNNTRGTYEKWFKEWKEEQKQTYLSKLRELLNEIDDLDGKVGGHTIKLACQRLISLKFPKLKEEKSP